MSEVQSILTEVTGQYIDVQGKTRLLQYDNVCMTVPPMAPIDVIIIAKDDIQPAKSEKKLSSFLKTRGLVMKSRRVVDDKTVGIFVTRHDVTYYIPTNDLPSLSSLLVEESLPSILIEERYSKLEKFREAKSLKNILVQYTLYTASHNDGTISSENFVVIPDHDYDVDNMDVHFDLQSPNIYQDGKIIVTSRKMRSELINTVNAYKLSNRQKLVAYSERISLQDEGKVYSDATSTVFVGKQALRSWLATRSDDIYVIKTSLNHNSKLPYFFKHFILTGDVVVMIQNVAGGSLAKAFTVGSIWMRENKNIGYDPQKLEEPESYFIYSEQERNEVKLNPKQVNLIEYTTGDIACVIPFYV